MDRRQLKTRKAIFQAFQTLLARKRYDRITVQQIIDEADVGRSTFYAHFETKDLLLDAMCQNLFYHVFEKDPCPWVGKDRELEGRLSHILWHVREQKGDMTAVLLSDSGELFMEYFRGHLRQVFEEHIDQFKIRVPRDFLLHMLVGSFSEVVKWWINEDMKTPAEAVAENFMKLLEKHES